MFLNYSNLKILSGSDEFTPKIEIEPPAASRKGDYSCLVRMHGFGQDFEKEVFGVSPQQALLLAIRQVNYIIVNSTEAENGHVYCVMADGTKALLVPELIGEPSPT